MSYFAGRMHKLKMRDIKGMQYHNQRERESKTNRDIDERKTSENYDFVNNRKIDYKAKIEQRIREGVISNRKTRKDAVVCCQWIVTSDKTFFDKLSKDEEKRFFGIAHKWLEERYGKENIMFATVHKDEHTPHMHVGIVPIKNGRLSAKTMFDKKELLYVQAELPMELQRQGFDLQRGIPNKQEHMEPVKFKNKELIEKFMEVNMELEKKLQELAKVQQPERDIDKIEVKKGGLLNKGKVIVNENDWEYLKSKAKQAISLKFDLDKSEQDKKMILERNRMLEDSAKKYNQLANFMGKEQVDKLVEDTISKFFEKENELEAVRGERER